MVAEAFGESRAANHRDRQWETVRRTRVDLPSVGTQSQCSTSGDNYGGAMASVVPRESSFDAGIDVLSDLGYGGLKLAEVCNRLGVTTGSFYHYFASWSAYTRALVSHWMQARTVSVI